MLRFRRSSESPRIEMVPLIDVIFLVLTFFIYAMVLMIPARVLPMQLQPLAGGERGDAAPAVTISIDASGRIAVDRNFIELANLRSAVDAAVEASPGAAVYITWAEQGEGDRLPLYGRVMSELADGGFDIRIVGRPAHEAP